MSSYEISAMVGQQQQMMAGQMQHASMISQMAGPQPLGENLMGRATNMATGIGSPLLQGGMALAGADPFSMAIRGGMMGFGMGGLAGAAGGAALGAGAVGVPLMAAQYAGTQMLQGGQQQQQLNAMLRQQYGQMGVQGQGFSSTGSSGIGQMLRQQSMQRGSAGEFASFEELGQLAGRMGQMGLGGQAARDAFEFNDKFKTMLGQVKDIAKALNTSLEEAQQVMSSMRGAGIFKNQGQIAQTIREVSMAGGMATSEVTGMMSVGAQFSRMLGGRGSSGAAGGIQTINQIGMAQQTGLLSDERLYDLTGQTGAEGRRALGVQRMQQASQFLRGGLGRRMVASMAGSDGTLDEDSVDAWQNGGMSTDETMGSAGRNLGKVGRANFIRNEGRLRGEVLGKFGGLAPIAAMSGWLEKRGMDPNSDRGQIFMSRRLGMSVEEVEQQLKEFRSLQLMEGTKGDRMSDANMRSDLELMKSGKGLSGVKKKFEDARNKVQGSLRQLGAEFYQSGSDMLEKWAATVTGDFEMTVDKDIGQAIRSAASGFGASSEQAWRKRFGMGGSMLQSYRQEGMAAATAGRVTSMTTRETFAAAGGAAKYKAAGWNMTPVGTDEQLRAQLTAIRDIRTAGMQGGAAGEEKLRAFGEKERGTLLAVAGTGGMQGQGQKFLSKFGEVLARSGDKELSKKYATAGWEERARMARDIMGGAGLSSVVDTAMRDPGGRGIYGAGGFKTTGERHEGFADLLKDTGRTEEQIAYLAEKEDQGSTLVSAALVGAAFLGGGSLVTAAEKGLSALGTDVRKEGGKAARGAAERGWMPGIRAGVLGLFGGTSGFAAATAMNEKDVMKGDKGMTAAQRRAAAAFGDTERGRDLAMDALSTEPKERERARQDAYRRNIQLLNRGDGTVNALDNLERGEFEFNQSVTATSLLADAQAKAKAEGRELSAEDEAMLVSRAKSLGMENVGSIADLRSRARFAGGLVAQKEEESRRQYIRQRGKAGQEFIKSLTASGALKGGRLDISGLGGPEAMVEGGSLEAKALGLEEAGLHQVSAAGLYAARMTKAAQMEAEALDMDPAQAIEHMREASKLRGKGTTEISAMSPKQLREMAKGLSSDEKLGVRGVEMGRELKAVAGLEEKALRAGRSGTARMAEQFGQMLGVTLSDEELRGLKGKGTNEVAALLSASSGLDEASQKDLRDALEAAKKGEHGAGAKLRQLQGAAAEAQREKRYKDAERDDPAVRKMDEVKTAIESMAKGILRTTVVNAAELRGNDDPEGTGTGTRVP